MNELCAINLNLDRLWTEQGNQVKQLEDNAKNIREEIATKNTIIKLLSENLIQITNSFCKSNNKYIITKNQENGNCELSKDNSAIRSKNKILFKSHNNTNNNIATFNCFATLYDDEISNGVTEPNNQNGVILTTTNNAITGDIRKKAFLQSNHKKRPAVVINQYPENQSVFTKKPTAPGEQCYSETIKKLINNQNVNTKIFSDSIVKGIGIRIQILQCK